MSVSVPGTVIGCPCLAVISSNKLRRATRVEHPVNRQLVDRQSVSGTLAGRRVIDNLATGNSSRQFDHSSGDGRGYVQK